MTRSFSLTLALLGATAAGTLAAAAPAKPGVPVLAATPAKVTLRLGEGKQLKARLKGRPGPVRWRVEGTGTGTVTSSGYYHAPSESQTPATVRVTAFVGGEPPLQSEVLVFIEAVSVDIRESEVKLSTAQTHQFHAGVRGTGDQRVKWAVEGDAGNGEVTQTGLYTAPSRFLTPGTVTVRATSLADPSKSATSTLRIGAVGITIEPKEITLQHGLSRRFAAKVTGTPNLGVEWQVVGDRQGEISSSGLYTTPSTMTTPSVVTVVASSAADPSKTATARIRILPVEVTGTDGPKGQKKKKGGNGGIVGTASRLFRSAVSKVTRIYLPFNPLDVIVKGPRFKGKSGRQYVPLGGGVALGANVANTTNDRVSWQLEGLKIGEVAEDGTYLAPDKLTTPQVVQVRATSDADPSKSVVFTLHIPPVVVVAEDPECVCQIGAACQLKAKVENSEDDRLTWSVDGGEKFGTISETGLYQPPSQITTPAVVRVRATSVADPTKSAVIQITVPEVRLEVSPGSAEVRPGESVRLKARVKGGMGAEEVAWSLTPDVGVITPDGLYRAPESGGAQVVQVTATLKADPTKIAVTTLRLKGHR